MNFKESRAIYLQIADRICDDILLGQYEEEGRIPSMPLRMPLFCSFEIIALVGCGISETLICR